MRTARSFSWKARQAGSKGRPRKVEQRADLGLRIVDQRLVDDAVDPARQDRVEMRHQRDIVAIIAAELGQVVGEALAAGEMLLEVGEAAGERVAARVDDLGVGQDQADQADMQPSCWASCR